MIFVWFRSKLFQSWRNTVCLLSELHDYTQTFADDFREILCEYTFVTPMVGIMQLFYYPEQCMLLNAVGELSKYGTIS